MTVAAPAPVSAVAQLLKLAALTLPQSSVPNASARAPDQFVPAPPPTLEALLHLAVTGQHNLGTLIPVLQRMLVADPAPLPVGHLSRAIGDAAHWVNAGAAGLPTANEADLTPAWRQTTGATLHEATAMLARAELALGTIPQPQPNPDVIWAMNQIANAQRQIGRAQSALAARPRPLVEPATRRPDFSRIIALFGSALLILILALAYGTWLVTAAILGTIAALAWTWRLIAASRTLKLEIRR